MNKIKLTLISIMLIIMSTILLNGCTSKSYEIAKTIYIANKKVIIENYDDLSPNSKNLVDKFESIDEVIVNIDKKIEIYKEIKENNEIKIIETEIEE